MEFRYEEYLMYQAEATAMPRLLKRSFRLPHLPSKYGKERANGTASPSLPSDLIFLSEKVCLLQY